MLNKEKVKLMTKISAYESQIGSEDLKIASYYRKDYTSLNTLITVLWTTAGYVMLAGLIAIGNLDAIMKNLTITKMIVLVSVVAGLYVVLLIAYCIYANSFYKTKHNKAKQRVKKLYRDLSRLEKINAKEKR